PLKVAFFFVCLDPTHVPAGWTSSPMAQGFVRHQMLWFDDKTKPADDKNAHDLALLDLPESVSLQIEPGEHHVLMGLAVRVDRDEPSWETLATVEGRLRVQPDAPVRLDVEVSGRLSGRRTRTSGYACRL